MKTFTVEVVRSVGASEKVLSEVEIQESSEQKARTKALLLLAPWRHRGATSTRLLKRRRLSPPRNTPYRF